MRHNEIFHTVDFCVVGGGLAGLLAAVSAARSGAKVLLMQDRPMLGGNCSSEVRMWVRGAHGAYNHETGLLEELELDNIARNPTCNFSIWDSVMYNLAIQEPNLTLLLNCSCLDATVDGDRITSVTGWQLTTYTTHTVYATLFADCSGDSILAEMTGAQYRVGREAASEFGEDIEPAVADKKTMGMTCLLQARQTDHPVPFTPPPFAECYPDDTKFAYRGYNLYDTSTNYWWMELGGEQDSIRDTESLRDRLLAVAYGVWDHIKNHGDHGADNWELEWIGFLPGKRESRRYVAAHTLTQDEVRAGGRFPDVVAYGGWSMDDHNPAGLDYPGEPTIFHPAPSPFGIPYRSLYSANRSNLLFAGRNIGVTHIALSSTRVMATCAIIGQAVGTAAGLAIARGLTPQQVYEQALDELQQRLMTSGCFLPGFTRNMSEATQQATYSISTEDQAVLLDGMDRDRPDETHHITLPIGATISMQWEKPTPVSELRLAFDTDLLRESVANDPQLRRFPMRCNIPMDAEWVKTPATIVKNCTVTVYNEYNEPVQTIQIKDNHQGLLFIPIHATISRLTVTFEQTHGAEKVQLFGMDIPNWAPATPGFRK